MHYCGIDIVKYKHEATVIDEGGKALLDSLFFSNKPRTTAGIDSSHRHRHRIVQALQYDLDDSGKRTAPGSRCRRRTGKRRIIPKNGGKNRFFCRRSYHLLKSLGLGGYTNDGRTGHPAFPRHYEMLQGL